MTWRTIAAVFVVGLVCFGAGLFCGSIALHKLATNTTNQSAEPDTPAFSSFVPGSKSSTFA